MGLGLGYGGYTPDLGGSLVLPPTGEVVAGVPRSALPTQVLFTRLTI